MCGVTKLDRMRNERIRGIMKVWKVSKQVEVLLAFYAKTGALHRKEVMEVQGRRKGRPKGRWLGTMDRVGDAIRMKELSR